MNFVITESDLFLIRVKEICFGNATIEMVLGDHTIEFMPSYIDREPLTTLIDLSYYIKWYFDRMLEIHIF